MKTLRDIGENGLLRELLPLLPQRSDTPVGPGDDCAVVRLPLSPHDRLFTTDPVIENRHFLPKTPAHLVGRKAIARAVSDIAAMGGEPLWILINLVAPGDTPLTRIRGLYTGMIAAAHQWNLGILGGDTSEGTTLELHITAIGRVPRGLAVLRSGARARHALYVTGALGGACLPGARHHLLFEPRLAAGRFLAEEQFASAMMDISDGLATDLPRLLDASRRGCFLETAAIPLSRAARKTEAPLHHALCDGEDFELLFTVAPSKIERFEAAWQRRFPDLPATRIGTILASPHQRHMRHADGTTTPLLPGGYQHFLPHTPPCPPEP
ncbi:MAG: thiamine-phosphate kinase [Kiritimatiellae bacterium]|jgi:thiamine-monophosphate kinase|nr:thiamine-phosphate kinase [Kiritimatiellia bacterium]MDD4342692.1 thiamine-phosphate kinase [Kiritimatiellia bacterium]MDY0149358.1 thiamine-phosphate kinase [Kiritimatiellia bacterium]